MLQPQCLLYYSSAYNALGSRYPYILAQFHNFFHISLKYHLPVEAPLGYPINLHHTLSNPFAIVFFYFFLQHPIYFNHVYFFSFNIFSIKVRILVLFPPVCPVPRIVSSIEEVFITYLLNKWDPVTAKRDWFHQYSKMIKWLKK